MFKSIFIKLCRERGLSPAFVMAQLGYSNSVFSKWTDNTVPRNDTLIKVAKYFDVSTDYLLGKEQPVDLTSVDFALSGEIRKLSENEKQDILDYIRFKQSHKDKRL